MRPSSANSHLSPQYNNTAQQGRNHDSHSRAPDSHTRGLGVDSRRGSAQVPGADVRQFTVIVEHGGVRPDVADPGPEGAEVAVPADGVYAVEVLSRLVEEFLRRRQVLVVEVVLGDPLCYVRETAVVVLLN